MIGRLLLFAVLLTPLPFASVHTWAWSLFGVVVAGLLAAWSVRWLATGAWLRVAPRQVRWALLPYALALAWALLQACPAVPTALHHPLWTDAATVTGGTAAGAISLDPARSLQGVARLLIYAAVFWLALQYGRSERFARLALTAIAITGGLYAIYGLVVYAIGSETILWYPKRYYIGSLTSSFVNRNNYAAFAGLGFLCAAGLLMQRLHEALTGVGRRSVQGAIVVEELFSRGGALSVSAICCLAALLLTGSRGGLTVTVAGAFALVGVQLFNGTIARRWSLGLLGGLSLCLGLVLAVSGQSTAERLSNTEWQTEERLYVWEQTLSAIGERPFLGTGLGTFPEVFRAHRPVETSANFEKAHNSYLENALELGVPAALLLVLPLFLLGARCLRGALTRQLTPGFAAIGFAASLLLGLHSLVDFPLQAPAIGATYALILGVAVAQSWSTRLDLGQVAT